MKLASNIHRVSGNCWKGFQSQGSNVKVVCVQMCACYNVGGIHFDGVTSRLVYCCYTSIVVTATITHPITEAFLQQFVLKHEAFAVILLTCWMWCHWYTLSWPVDHMRIRAGFCGRICFPASASRKPGDVLAHNRDVKSKGKLAYQRSHGKRSLKSGMLVLGFDIWEAYKSLALAMKLMSLALVLPFSSNRQHLSYDGCLEVRTVLCCIVYWSCAQS